MSMVSLSENDRNWGSETKSHKVLKERGRKLLQKMGFAKGEIFTEYRLNNSLVIDVVGINKKSKVAVECGWLHSPTRLRELSDYFNKVIHLPYLGSPFYPLSKHRTANYCLICGEDVTAFARNVKYCSLRCLSIANDPNRQRKHPNCLYCGKKIPREYRSNIKYCSKRCLNKKQYKESLVKALT